MHPSYFVNRIKELSGLDYLTQKEVKAITRAIFTFIRQEVRSAGRLSFNRLGSFFVRVRPPREAISPQGKLCKVPERKVVRFRPSKQFLDEVRSGD